MRLYKGSIITILVITAVMAVFIVGYNFYDSGIGRGIRIRYERASASDTSSAPAPLNLNTASRDELMALDGIGDERADAIIAYRETHGGFASVDELTEVPGIGAKLLESLRSRRCVE